MCAIHIVSVIIKLLKCILRTMRNTIVRFEDPSLQSFKSQMKNFNLSFHSPLNWTSHSLFHQQWSPFAPFFWGFTVWFKQLLVLYETFLPTQLSCTPRPFQPFCPSFESFSWLSTCSKVCTCVSGPSDLTGTGEEHFIFNKYILDYFPASFIPLHEKTNWNILKEICFSTMKWLLRLR